MGKYMNIAIEAGNLNYNRKYKESIKLLDKYYDLLEENEDISQFNIVYALNYEKLKDIEKCNYHCEKAVELFHSGNYAYKRLMINYTKLKDWKNVLRICNIVLSRKKIFGKPTWDDLEEYTINRRKFIENKIDISKN